MVATRRKTHDVDQKTEVEEEPPTKRARSSGSKMSSKLKPASKASDTISTKRSKIKATKPETPMEAPRGPRYFLMKAEPESRLEDGIDVKFSIDDLKSRGEAGEPWDGVRNAEASKIMRTEMQVGDLAFFYHSNTKEPGIAGIMKIKRAGYPDSSAWEKGHPYFDAKTDQEKPKWWRVDVEYVRHVKRFIGLRELRGYKEGKLGKMQLLSRPQLSVQRVTPDEWEFVMGLEEKDA